MLSEKEFNKKIGGAYNFLHEELYACEESLIWVNANDGKTLHWLWDNCKNGCWLIWLLSNIDVSKHYYLGASIACLQGALNNTTILHAERTRVILRSIWGNHVGVNADYTAEFLNNYGELIGRDMVYSGLTVDKNMWEIDVVTSFFIKAVCDPDCGSWGLHGGVLDLAESCDSFKQQIKLEKQFANRIREFVPWNMIQQMIEDYIESGSYD